MSAQYRNLAYVAQKPAFLMKAYGPGSGRDKRDEDGPITVDDGRGTLSDREEEGDEAPQVVVLESKRKSGRTGKEKDTGANQDSLQTKNTTQEVATDTKKGDTSLNFSSAGPTSKRKMDSAAAGSEVVKRRKDDLPIKSKESAKAKTKAKTKAAGPLSFD